jgi:hypothetical protein
VIIANPNSSLKPTYGFGRAMAAYPVLGLMYYHNGGHPGFTTYYLRCPEKRVIVVFLFNLDASPAVNNVRTELLGLIHTIVK